MEPPWIGGSERPWIGGVSNGGLLALELARQLRARGVELGGVFLLDSIPPTLLARAPWHERQSRERIAAFAAQLRGPSAPELPLAAEATLAFAQLSEHLREQASNGRSPTLQNPLPSAAELEQMYRRYERHSERVWRVLSAIEITPLDGPVDLFEAREIGRWPRPLAPLWRRELAQLRVHAVSGDHRTMLGSTHAEGLAQVMSRVAACAKL